MDETLPHFVTVYFPRNSQGYLDVTAVSYLTQLGRQRAVTEYRDTPAHSACSAGSNGGDEESENDWGSDVEGNK